MTLLACDIPLGLQHSASLMTVTVCVSPQPSATKPWIFVNWMHKTGSLGALSISLAVSEMRGLFLSLRCSPSATGCVKATQEGYLWKRWAGSENSHLVYFKVVLGWEHP